MRSLLVICAALLLLLPQQASAHRLDEYLQATMLTIESRQVQVSVRMVPGVAVFSTVIKSIDTNGDGVISLAEQQAYTESVVRDLSLSADGQRLSLHPISATFPPVDTLRQGLGEIQLVFAADLPHGTASRQLVFENHHRRDMSVYLVNCLVPQDKDIAIAGQSRSENQAFYQLNFTQKSGETGRATVPSLSGFTGAFRLGLRHIAEGTDHLLFLLALLLPAPLLAIGGYWKQSTTVHRSLMHILSIVTSFTVGHSLTLALAAFGLVRLPSRPIEALIAVSILVSAIHAMRPMFPGREAAVAAFFGLIHGLAFASALSDLGVSGWYRLVSILGFNLGIESMQLVVVAATLPPLLLLSRTPVYSYFRIGGALFAAVASAGWIVERSFNASNIIGPFVEAIAHHAIWIAALLLLLSLLCWPLRNSPGETNTTTDDRRHPIPENVWVP